MFVGFVSESAMKHLEETINMLLGIGKSFDYSEKYSNEYFNIICLLMCMEAKVLKREWFVQVNDWICHFCHLDEIDLKHNTPVIYNGVMEFTTRFCWDIGYCGKSEIYVRTENMNR